MEADPAQFATVVRQHQAMVFSIALHFLRDRTAAEDVAQEVFLQLHQNLAAIESPAHLTSWLRKVSCQRSIDSSRRRRIRAHRTLDDMPEPASTPNPADPLLSGHLHRLVATLPDRARMLVILRYQEDLDPADIARTLDVPVATVKSQLHRALAVLRKKIERVTLEPKMEPKGALQ